MTDFYKSVRLEKQLKKNKWATMLNAPRVEGEKDSKNLLMPAMKKALVIFLIIVLESKT